MMNRTKPEAGLRSLLAMPEVNIAIFAFLLNFVWEFLQIPFFQNMSQLSHWEGVKICAAAAVSDVVIMLVAFWSVAVITRTRNWVLAPQVAHLAAFVAIGIAITIGIEIFALTTGRWAYSEAMPIIPLFEVGLVPILQWVVLPLLTVWFVNRQLS
jgi:hypothetical protein